MDKDQELLVGWLTDAYSMEDSLVQSLEKQSKELQDSEIVERIKSHTEETKRHKEMIKECLSRYGKNPSTIKSTIGKAAIGLQNIATGSSEVKPVRDTLFDYAAENFAVASYKALITAATNIGDAETVNVCEQILHDEEDMANFLENHLTRVVNSVMAKHGES